MKKFRHTLIVSVIVTFSLFVLKGVKSAAATVTIIEDEPKTEIVEEEAPAVDKWDLFIEAVIWQESRGNTNAIGDNGKAVGVLQIHPIMVREANRLIAMKGGEKDYFSYDDRYSKEKSIEIFKVVQDHYNGEHNHVKALEIWNKNHPESYRRNIINKYNSYLNEYKTTGGNVPGSV